jgi:hypothetical protein
MIDSTTMQEFDQECRTPIIKLSPCVIRKFRIKASISQASSPRIMVVDTLLCRISFCCTPIGLPVRDFPLGRKVAFSYTCTHADSFPE